MLLADVADSPISYVRSDFCDAASIKPSGSCAYILYSVLSQMGNMRYAIYCFLVIVDVS